MSPRLMALAIRFDKLVAHGEAAKVGHLNGEVWGGSYPMMWLTMAVFFRF